MLFTSLYPDVKDEWTRQTLKEYLLKNAQGMIPLFYRAIEVVADLQAKLEEKERFLTDANAALMDWENREAAICPEDYGFEEVIQRLRTENAALKRPVTDEECHNFGWMIGDRYRFDPENVEKLLASRSQQAPASATEGQRPENR